MSFHFKVYCWSCENDNKSKRTLSSAGILPRIYRYFCKPFLSCTLGPSESYGVQFSSKLKGRLLDVGCGSKPYQELFAVDDYIGLDIDNEAMRNRKIADYFYDGTTFPFNDNEYDSVLCNQVLEHVFNPDEFLSEIKRVLKPGGRLLLTVPFVWDEHEQPHDYARYSSFGLKALIDKNGFNVIEYKKIMHGCIDYFPAYKCLSV